MAIQRVLLLSSLFLGSATVFLSPFLSSVAVGVDFGSVLGDLEAEGDAEGSGFVAPSRARRGLTLAGPGSPSPSRRTLRGRMEP
ncbi:hypothetical protein SBI_03384 [Streptomyces bingchenggensis BCW-1]|uniref:Uncharacterized protein n=1 Tax=Streptomyces bingchenggensis (strain BCW-1) TaxID=749414 RepID=D7CAE8_STRBB|nr:hypothetical protein SBI_03384 [Streptomyces bingchenggensis BCW-1]